MYLCTCRSDGCDNGGIAIPMQLDIDLGDPEPFHIDTVLCGVCGEPITDVQPAPAD